MLEKFAIWFNENNTEITWFLIGWMCRSGFENLGRGSLEFALLDFALAYFNYYMWKSRQ